MSGFFLLVALILFSASLPHLAMAQGQSPDPGSALFEKMCYSCHNVGGGDKKGPDLRAVTSRRGRDWLHRYIPSPQTMKNSGDATASQLFAKYAPEIMPDQMLSTDQIDQILNLIQGLTERNRAFVPQSGQLPRQPTAQDPPAGQSLFIGDRPLAKGGPPCLSCHSVTRVGALGGGSLGPDLTNANVKYSNVELAAILKAPAFPTMSKVFANHALTDEEVVQLFAFLQSTRALTPDGAQDTAHYLFVGAIGVLTLFAFASFAWRRRFRGVRKRLVE